MDENTNSQASPIMESVPNPIATALTVSVSVPEAIEIKMVDASVLTDYEMWFFLSSILASTVIGFATVWIQEDFNPTFGSISVVFLVLFICTISMTLWKRQQLRSKSKSVQLSVNQS